MQNLNIVILARDRALQVKALIESFFLNLKNYHPVQFTVLYDSDWSENYLYREVSAKFQEEFPHIKFEFVTFDDSFKLEPYFKEKEYNLVLTDNVIFSLPFDLNNLYYLEDDEVFDLFKGINRTQLSKGTFLHEAHKWKKRDHLYYLENGKDAFEDVTQKVQYLGKIFKLNDKPLNERAHFFSGLSPCFINGVSIEDSIDSFDTDTLIEYGVYPLCMRYLVEEKIDVEVIQNYCPNRIVDLYKFKFKREADYPSFDTFIKHGLYINLDSRTDRKSLVEKEISDNFGTEFIRIPGIIPSDQEVEGINASKTLDQHSLDLSKARIGATKSHLAAVEYAKSQNWDMVLILEDDCKFLPNLKRILPQALEELHYLPKWDMLYLGANSLGTIKQLSPHIGKLTGAFCLHAYIVPKHFYDTFLSFDWQQYRTIDEWSFNICRDSRYNAYTVLPILAVQQASHSDIEGFTVNYEEVLINSYKNTLNK